MEREGGEKKNRNSPFPHKPKCTLFTPPPPPPQFCLTIVFDFSWDDCTTHEKFEMMVMQIFFRVGSGGGGANKIHYGLCENGE